MGAIKRSDTKPEIQLRSLLHAAGLRFRKDYFIKLHDGQRARPDVAFTRIQVAVFYDSCFWHSCPEHGRQPTVNEWYWKPKLLRTVERDRSTTSALTAAGWKVLRFWEHEGIESAAERLTNAVRLRYADINARPG